MTFKEETVRNLPVFMLEGKIMGDCQSQAVCERMKQLIREGQHHIILDLNGVRWINSSGIGSIISCLRMIREQGGDLYLTGVHGRVAQYLSITRLDTQIEVFDTWNEVVERLNIRGSLAELQ